MRPLLLIKRSDYKYLIIACLFACIGLYGIGMVFFHGQEHSYGVSREVPLGLLLIGYAFFVGVSVGLSVVATLSHVFKFEAYHYRGRHIALISFATLIAAFYLIFWELGGPFELQVFRFIKYYTNFEISSPIWWMSTFYLFETPLLALEIYLLIKGSKKATFYAGIVGFILGLLAFSTLSMVFAVNAAKPLWHTAQFTISFVLGALVCGGAVVLIFMSLRINKPSNETINAVTNMMLFLLIAILFIHLWTAVISLYGKGGYLAENMKILTSGPLSFNFYFFEIFIGVIVPITLILLSGFKDLKINTIAAFAAIIGVFFSRYDSVVGGQLIRVESEFLPKLEITHYTPSLSEITIFISAIGVTMLIYEVGNIWLKLNEEGEES